MGGGGRSGLEGEGKGGREQMSEQMGGEEVGKRREGGGKGRRIGRNGMDNKETTCCSLSFLIAIRGSLISVYLLNRCLVTSV